MELYVLIGIAFMWVVVILLIVFFRNRQGGDLQLLHNKINELQSDLVKLEGHLKQDFKLNREEYTSLSRDNRTELNTTLKDLKSELAMTLKSINEQNQQSLREINKTLADKIDLLVIKVDVNNKENRDSLNLNLRDFILDQRLKMDELKKEQKDMAVKTLDQLEKILSKVEDKLTALNEQSRTDHQRMREEITTSFKDFQEAVQVKQSELVRNTENKLESIRSTVEEKLEKTLSERLGQSFETVGKQLIEVQKGLGEMQTMAADVGGLKKVLSNVKLRGGIGEVQLAMLLEQILAPSQYEANVATVEGSAERVEFAVKLPGRNNDENSFIYLPIDAKFPKDPYEQLISAYENAVPDDIEAASKNLENTIRKMARDIRDKYLGPNTTDFAILFLPFESIYAEVIRRSALVDQLRFEYQITVAGPTTLMALLNSLQMGFRAMALQKRSGEVWKVLARVKSEFEKFGGLLEKARKNIQTGLGQLETASGIRTRAIQRQLSDIDAMPSPGLPPGLEDNGLGEMTEPDEDLESNRQPEFPFD